MESRAQAMTEVPCPVAPCAIEGGGGMYVDVANDPTRKFILERSAPGDEFRRSELSESVCPRTPVRPARRARATSAIFVRCILCRFPLCGSCHLGGHFQSPSERFHGTHDIVRRRCPGTDADSDNLLADPRRTPDPAFAQLLNLLDRSRGQIVGVAADKH